MDAEFYPYADYRPTHILGRLGTRSQTWAVVEHETYGLPADKYLAGQSSEGGDESVFLNTYPVHFYCLRSGAVRQYAPLSRVTFHAFSPANELAISVEHEGRNDVPWTPAQLASSARLNAWLHGVTGLPIRHAAHPREGDRASWAGYMAHADLTAAGIGGAQQNHTDTIPGNLGWAGFLAAVQEAASGHAQHAAPAWPPPDGDTLRLELPANPHSPFRGWGECRGPLLWIAAHGLAPDTTAALAWQRHVSRGPAAVEATARDLVRRFLS